MNHLSPPAAGAPVNSPCISVCKIDTTTGWCEGCLRSIEEIVAWGQWSAPQRLDVWRELESRSRELVRLRAA